MESPLSYQLDSTDNLQMLIDSVGDAKVVKLGEATHGTHEFYTWRALISRVLIQQKRFNFIGIEGDWPDCYKINRFIKGYEDAGENALGIVKSFDRLPTWMWANWEIIAFASWLKSHNSTLPMEQRVGFYGLDVYSLWDSMHVLIPFLQQEDPSAVKTVKAALKCFEPYDEKGTNYARAATYFSDSCRDKALAILKEIKSKSPTYQTYREAAFSAEQNARIVVNAEEYYRSMVGFDANSWNIRDGHMMETLDHLLEFQQGKGIVWANNSHVGDARATTMVKRCTVNIGQLAREKYGKEHVFLTSFATYEGSVIASHEWGAPMQVMKVPKAREASAEEMIHKTHQSNRLYLLQDDHAGFENVIPHRAIGVVYNPEMEKYGNYVPSNLSARYDALIYLDKTTALHPLHLRPNSHKTPETYPFGM